MKDSTQKKIKELGLDPKEFTTTTPDTLEGHIVLGDPKRFGNNKDNCLFKAIGGFGCVKGCAGSAVFVDRLVDGHKLRIEKYDIIAVKVVE